MMIIQRKDITRSKITIAKDEIRVKLPIGLDEVESTRIILFATKVVKDVGPVANTKRGKITKSPKDEFTVTLYEGSPPRMNPVTVKEFDAD